MSVLEQINEYIAIQPEPKQGEMQQLHQLILQLMPNCQQWYFDGKNEAGKQVTYPTIGYGTYTITYKNGSTRPFFRIGLLANPKGLSVYIMGLEDKNYLKDNYEKTIGKASISSYGIKFKSVNDINLELLKEAIVNRTASEN
jgi:hypothetical protein